MTEWKTRDQQLRGSLPMADLSQRCVSIYHQGLEAKGNTLMPISRYLLRLAPRKTEFWTPYCQVLSLSFVRFCSTNCDGFLLKPRQETDFSPITIFDSWGPDLTKLSPPSDSFGLLSHSFPPLSSLSLAYLR